MQLALVSTLELKELPRTGHAPGGLKLEMGDRVITVGSPVPSENGLCAILSQEVPGGWSLTDLTDGERIVQTSNLWKVPESLIGNPDPQDFLASAARSNVEALLSFLQTFEREPLQTGGARGELADEDAADSSLRLERLLLARAAFPVPSCKAVLRNLACSMLPGPALSPGSDSVAAAADAGASAVAAPPGSLSPGPAALFLLQEECSILEIQREPAAALAAVEAVGLTDVTRMYMRMYMLPAIYAGQTGGQEGERTSETGEQAGGEPSSLTTHPPKAITVDDRRVHLDTWSAALRPGFSVSRGGLLMLLRAHRRSSAERRRGELEHASACEKCEECEECGAPLTFDAEMCSGCNECAGCSQVHYCSARCQTVAWPRHLFDCKGTGNVRVAGGSPIEVNEHWSGSAAHVAGQLSGGFVTRYRHQEEFSCGMIFCAFCKSRTTSIWYNSFLLCEGTVRRVRVQKRRCKCGAVFGPHDVEATCGVLVFHG